MFDKFIEDEQKRISKKQEKKNNNKISVDEEEAKRLRNLRYNERWQNRIEWSNTDGQ